MLLPALGKRPIVLLGSAGTGTAFAAATALRRHWNDSVTILAMDINPKQLVTTSLLADMFQQVPLSENPEFPAVLMELIDKYHIDTYLPLLDVELACAAELRGASLLPGELCLLAPPESTAHICLDKYRAAVWMGHQGIPTPTTSLASKPFAGESFFLKPRKGFGSRGTRIISRAELETILPVERDAWIIQTVCAEPEVTIDAFHDPDRHLLRVACRVRLETKSGVCTKARVFFDSELEHLAARLAGRLDLVGTFCFQVMRSESGWLVTDINARPGAGTAISVAAGMDFFGALFARAWGLDARPALPLLTREKIVTRQYSEFVMT
jgi:carbamoylphosphate synthase large subunit